MGHYLVLSSLIDTPYSFLGEPFKYDLTSLSEKLSLPVPSQLGEGARQFMLSKLGVVVRWQQTESPHDSEPTPTPTPVIGDTSLGGGETHAIKKNCIAQISNYINQ